MSLLREGNPAHPEGPTVYAVFGMFVLFPEVLPEARGVRILGPFVKEKQ